MKKVFVILLTLLFLVSSTGFTRYQYLCKSMAVKLYSLNKKQDQPSDKPCKICASKDKSLTKKKKNCCQQETQIVQLDKSIKQHNKLDSSVKFLGDSIPTKMIGTVFDLSFNTAVSHAFPFITSKIPIRGNPLYILNCVYRI